MADMWDDDDKDYEISDDEEEWRLFESAGKWSTENDALIKEGESDDEYSIVVCDGKVYAITCNPDREAFGSAYEIPPGECVHNRYQGFSYCVTKDGSTVYSMFGDYGTWPPNEPPDEIVRWGDKFCKVLGAEPEDYLDLDDEISDEEEDEEEMEMGM